MDAQLRHTPLYDWHVAHGGRMVDFAGWAMPVQYTSIIEEHLAIRSAVGIADISHMGRLRFEGPGAAVFLAELLTRRVADMELNQIRYSLITNDDGGILDDVLVGYYHNSTRPAVLPRGGQCQQPGEDRRLGRRPSAPQRAERPGHEIVWTDVSRLWAMIAVQGPRVGRTAATADRRRSPVDALLSRGAGLILHPAAERQGCIISRTGYTGEDGFELSLGRQHRPGRVGGAGGDGPAAGRGAGRPRRPRHLAARSRHAALRPRAFGANRSRSRPAWVSPATW